MRLPFAISIFNIPIVSRFLFVPAVCKAGPKRCRLLRQPRVKKESNHLSPDSESSSPHIVSSSIYMTAPTLNLPQTSKSWDEARVSPPSQQSILVNQPSLLTVTTSTNLLTVPQPSYLMKQHSHPLLSSQQQSSSGNYWTVYRQHSNPEFPSRTTSPSIVVEPAPVVKTEEEITQDEPSTATTTTETTTGSTSGLRVKTTELRRSSSSPQVWNISLIKWSSFRFDNFTEFKLLRWQLVRGP